MSSKMLALPPHYKKRNAAEEEYHPQDVFGLLQEAVAWRRKNDLQPVGSDRKRVHLLVIDNQWDFDFLTGSLFVAGQSGTGATDDAARLAEFGYRNLGVISQITPTMDSHLPYQVFFPSAHVLADGSHPAPFTVITEEEYRSGVYKANPEMAAQLGVDQAWLTRQFIHYTAELSRSGKYALTLWPYHCLIGSHGHKLAGLVDELRLFHAFARGAENNPEIKGGNPLTEHYSIFQPEVTTLWTGEAIPGVQKNTRLLETLMKSDYVVIAGQAASHCLAWTIKDLLTHILAEDPDLARKVYILKDATSPVVVRDGSGNVLVDYTPDQEKAFDEFQNAGMHLVDSTEPMESWADLTL